MRQTLLFCVLASVATSASLHRVKRQYESEIVAISPNGKWTSVFHQPLDAIREKGLPLLEHHGALRDVQSYPATGPSPYALPAYLHNPYLNTRISPSANPLPNSYGRQAPRLLIVVPPGTHLPPSVAVHFPALPVGTVPDTLPTVPLATVSASPVPVFPSLNPVAVSPYPAFQSVVSSSPLPLLQAEPLNAYSRA